MICAHLFRRLVLLPAAISLVTACGGNSLTSSEKVVVQALPQSASRAMGVDSNLKVEKEKPLIFDFTRQRDYINNSGTWLYRSAEPRYVSDQGHTLPGALLMLRRKEPWHGALMRLPRLEPSRAHTISVWVKPVDTVDSTRFKLVLTRVSDGVTSRLVLNEQTVEPGNWQHLQGEFVEAELGRDFIQTLHLEAEPVVTNYLLDDVGIAFSEYSDQLEKAAEAQVKRLGGRFVRNGSAEEGLEPWTYQGGLISRSVIQAHTGKHSVLISGRLQGWNAPVMALHGLENNKRYKISIFARLQEGSDPATMKLTLKRRTSGQSTFIPIGEGRASDSSWTEISGVYGSPNIGNSESVSVYLESESPTVAYYVDTLTVLQIP